MDEHFIKNTRKSGVVFTVPPEITFETALSQLEVEAKTEEEIQDRRLEEAKLEAEAERIQAKSVDKIENTMYNDDITKAIENEIEESLSKSKSKK